MPGTSVVTPTRRASGRRSPGVRTALCVLEALVPAEPLSLTGLGSRTRPFASASGRVILADRGPKVVAAQFAGRALVTPTGRRLRGAQELLQILEDVRRNGYAENDGETAAGLYAVSVPVRN